MVQLRIYHEDERQILVTPREGETRLGETVGLALPGCLVDEALVQSPARFVILGLPEDIGVRANGGVGGAHTAWPGFLKSFMHIQQTAAFRGEDFLLLGEYDFSGWLVNCSSASIEQLRSYTAHIDAEVHPLIHKIVAAGKIPVVVGGGHNNAYPLLKGTALALGKPLNAINLDAHSDYRVMEGRHSGNGFRYAHQEHFLIRYAMLGLHEAYNSQPVVAELNSNPDLLPLFWEDMFLRGKTGWEESLHQALDFVSDAPFGVELDLDCIQHVLSSAATPVGITTQHALQYLYQCGLHANARYVHLPEGVVERADGQHDVFTGKLLSYLVQAFTKGVLERQSS
ncbi:formimidoylglutamase [Taibaiella koreensis]|uniref:formimidoylglutamase n=1 Tax=Taibaiella koreensis TaxID=1268548 RepID=UPI000E5A0725|nr:formimidoylglutamase [Taibaiella koreensis]